MKGSGRFDADKWDADANSDKDYGYAELFPGAGTTGNKVVINDSEV